MATIATLIVDIAANTATLKQDVAKATATLDSITGVASKLAPVLAGVFSIAAAVQFGRAVLDDADALQKLHDKTGLSTDALQRFRIAGDDAGNTVDEMALAVNKMQVKIAGDDKSAESALRKLGIAVEDFKAIGPEKQFYEISKAIQGVSDPADQAKIAVDLFGKAGAAILPTLKRGFDDVRDSAVGMSQDTVEALDDVGDTIQRWATRGKGAIATWMVESARNIESIGIPWLRRYQDAARDAAKAQEQIASMVKKLANPLAGAASVPDDPYKSAIDNADSLIRKMDDEASAHKKSSEEAIRHTKELQKLALEFRTTSAEVDQLNKMLALGPGQKLTEYDPFGGGLPGGDLLNTYSKAADAMKNMRSKAMGIDAQSIEASIAGAGSFGIENIGTKLAPVVYQGTASGFSTAVAALPGILQKAFTGGGGFTGAFKAFGSMLGSSLGGGLFEAGGALNSLGGKLTKVFGDGFGKALPVIGAAIGAVIGPLIGKLGSWIGGLFGNNAEKQINPIRQGFVDAAGGLDALNRKAAEAGVTLKAMLDAKNPEQYKKAIDDLNAALKLQDDAMAVLDETVKRYGFSIEELGPAMARQQLDKQAGQLFQDFKVLTAAGIDVDAVLMRMGGSVNDFVHSALRTGTEIPAAMAPMLQRMVEMGTLTDENGNVITDLEKSGVHFALTMSQGFEKIVGAVEKLTEAISRGLGLAIENIPDPDITARVHVVTDAPTDYSHDWTDQMSTETVPMAAGGVGTVSKPTLFLAGEAGSEQFAFSGAGRKFSGGGGQVVNFDEMKAELMAMREQQALHGAYLQGQQAKDFARAMRDELQKVARVRR